jgi:hypothetical protein
MSKNYLLALLVLFTLNINAQNVKTVNALLIKRSTVLEKIALEESLTKDDTLNFTILQNNKDYVEFSRNVYNHSAVSGHKIIIQFLDNSDKPMTVSQANLASIKIYNKPKTDIDNNSKYVIIDLKEYLGDEPKNGELVKIEIKTHTGVDEVRWFRYINGWQGYNFLDNKFGLWFPTNMYSTSFEKSENGVQFTAMPIGLAIGGKYNINQNFYIGISGTLNYTLTSAKDSLSSTESYLLQDFAVGPLIDLGGYAYIGYTYPINLTNQNAQLKPQFVIGIGVKITQLLIGKDK